MKDIIAVVFILIYTFEDVYVESESLADANGESYDDNV